MFKKKFILKIVHDYNKYTFEYVKIFNEFSALEFYKLHLRTNYVDIRYFKRLMRLDKIWDGYTC